MPAEIEGNTTNEIISYLIKEILNKGLDKIRAGMSTEKNKERISQINSLTELIEKIKETKMALPQRSDIDKLFDDVNEVLSMLATGIQTIGAYHIISLYKIRKRIDELIGESEQTEKKQPPNTLPENKT